METASVSHDEEHQHAVISFADAAKVQQNFETAKDKNKNNKAHSYEVTKIELLDGLSNSPRLEMVESNPSISAAKVRRKSENTKKIEKQRDFKAPQALSGDTELTARAANVLNSVAKVQNNSETTKDLAKKTLPPSNYRTRT